jgi:CheY-like chemotaxis protein
MIRLHVLFADDESDVRDIIGASLDLDPLFASRGCGSGDEAVAMAIEWRPDLTLLDVAMPKMDGPTVLARLRADKRTAPIPIVFVTAFAHPHERERFQELGAAGVIAKPFDPMRLPVELRRFVPLEGTLSSAREDFMQRLAADAGSLAACRARLSQTHYEPALLRISAIAHALAGAGGIYGFAGISCESAALSAAARNHLAGCARRIDVEQALDRVLQRIKPSLQTPSRPLALAG